MPTGGSERCGIISWNNAVVISDNFPSADSVVPEILGSIRVATAFCVGVSVVAAASLLANAAVSAMRSARSAGTS